MELLIYSPSSCLLTDRFVHLSVSICKKKNFHGKARAGWTHTYYRTETTTMPLLLPGLRMFALLPSSTCTLLLDVTDSAGGEPDKIVTLFYFHAILVWIRVYPQLQEQAGVLRVGVVRFRM